MKNGINEINKVCQAVSRLTDEDFEEVRKMAQEQSGYVHPLKNATAKKYNEIGEHNIRVVNALQDLRDVIKNIDK